MCTQQACNWDDQNMVEVTNYWTLEIMFQLYNVMQSAAVYSRPAYTKIVHFSFRSIMFCRCHEWEKLREIEHGSFILANLLAASLEEWQWLPQWFMCMCLASTKLEQAYIMKMGWQQCNNATFPHCFTLQSSLGVAWLKFDHVPHLDIPLDHVGHCPSHELNYCCFPHAELFSYTVLKTSFFLLIIPNLHIKLC